MLPDSVHLGTNDPGGLFSAGSTLQGLPLSDKSRALTGSKNYLAKREKFLEEILFTISFAKGRH